MRKKIFEIICVIMVRPSNFADVSILGDEDAHQL